MQRRVDFCIADLRRRRSPNRCSILAFRRVFIKTLWRGHLLPRQRRQVLKQGRSSSRSAPPDGIRAVRMPILAIRPPRTPAPRRPLDPAAASHDLQQSRRGFDQLQPNPGWVAERFKAPVLKTGVPARVPWVRIPPHPLPPIRTEGGALLRPLQ
jgi:hypothetical protein